MSIDSPREEKRQPQGSEEIAVVSVLIYKRSDVLAWGDERREVPGRALARLLLDYTQDKLPPYQDGKREAMVNGERRRIVPVSFQFRAEPDLVFETGIEASRFLPHILVSRGHGPCTFTVGFRGREAFLTHNLIGSANSKSFKRFLGMLGIGSTSTDVEFFLGGGIKGKKGRRAVVRAFQELGLSYSDIGARSDSDSINWDTSAVAVDPEKRLIVVIAETGEEKGT